MSAKYNARELAFHYISSQHEKLSEEGYLRKLVNAEAEFIKLLAPANPPVPDDPLETWSKLGQQS